MSSYEYCVSLRVTHPDIDPNKITKALGIKPFRSWRAGEPRVSPKGTPLEGVSKESFWAAHTHKEKRLLSENIYLEDYISQFNKRLQPYASFFEELVNSGGYIEYFVGWFSENNVGATFEPSLMKETSALNIAIGLDVYVSEE